MNYLLEIYKKIQFFCIGKSAKGFEINYLENACDEKSKELLSLYNQALKLNDENTPEQELRKIYEKVNLLVD